MITTGDRPSPNSNPSPNTGTNPAAVSGSKEVGRRVNRANRHRGKTDFDYDFESDWLPELDAYEYDGKYIINIDIPGVAKEDVKIEVTDDGSIVIQGQRVREINFPEAKVSERSYGKFKRTVNLPAAAQIDNIQAKFENGVLHIEVPKRPGATHRVNIE